MASEPEIQAMLQSAEASRAAGHLTDAQRACRNILRLRPEHPDALHLLGVVLGQLGQSEEAEQMLRHAVRLQPGSAIVHYNLALALKLSGDFNEAIAELNRAIALNPNLAPAYCNLGITYKDTMRLAEAVPCYQRAIALRPDYADAHWNLALVLLRLGDFRQGLGEFEWRTKVKTLSPVPTFSQPRWNGESFPGRTLLLFPEQGIGDAIQFARYVPMAAERGGKVVLASRTQLVRVFERSFPMAQVFPLEGPVPHFDLQCSLVSLPLVFGTELDSIPGAIPYIRPEPELTEKWSKILGNRDGRLRVGIAWAGNPNHYNDAQRSMPASELSPLSQLKNISLYSLQKDRPSAPDVGLIDFTQNLQDFSDTAALVENLDLVLSVDTAIAHLAGAMGKPVWLLVPFVPDWRWLVDRSDSPWYPSMRLFRQERPGDWAGVIQRVAEELARQKTGT